MRHGLITLLLVLSCSAIPAAAQVRIDIGLPSVNLGINVPVFPALVVVPEYPVYYAPRLMEALLNDIDDVLEESAEEFVKGYIKRDGE